MNKKKIYRRTFPCYTCGYEVIAKYNPKIGKWIISCDCESDDHCKKLHKHFWVELK